jgi:phosphoribosylformylglycinamidine synthase
LDLPAENRLINLLVELISSGLVISAHDCSEGGLGVALAECAIASGVGASISADAELPPHVWLFSESSARAIVACRPGDLQAVLDRARAADVPPAHLGATGGQGVSVDGVLSVSLDRLREAYEDALPRVLS